MDRPLERNSISAICFDAVGTLLQPDPTVGTAYHTAGVLHGSQHAPSEVLLRFQAAFARSERQDAERGDGRTDETVELARWRRIVTEVFDDIADHSPLFDRLWQHFAAAENWRLFDDVEPCLAELRARGVRVGIASNFDSRLRTICRDLPPLDRYPHLFISSELGHRKPSVHFFRAIEQELELPPERLLLVGDTPENDYHAALAAGWQALLIDRKGRHVELPVEHRIASLTELALRSA